MTLGQHIQQLRKQAGFSQEALGEALGVTRQSISKWESDQAIPEVDKLVTLSRLFQVPVGVLLQVEAAPETEPVPSPAPPPAECPGSNRPLFWRVLFAALGAAALVWLALLTVSLFSRLDAVEERLSTLQMEVDALRAEERGQGAGDLSASVALESVDYRGGQAVFSVTAAPETVHEGMTARFFASSPEFFPDYGTIWTRGQLNSSGQYTASITCPLADNITVSVVFQYDGVEEVHTLSQRYSLLSDSCAWVECHPQLSEDAIQDGVCVWEAPVELTLHPAELEQGTLLVETAALDLRLFVNGKAVWGPLTVDLSQAADGVLSVPVSAALPLEVGDTLRLTALHRDTLDRVWLERLCEYQVEASPAGPRLVLRDQLIPNRVPFTADWAALESDAEYWTS